MTLGGFLKGITRQWKNSCRTAASGSHNETVLLLTNACPIWPFVLETERKLILRAALLAGALHVKTIGLTGAEGGKLPKCVDLCLRVPSAEPPRIQEAHTFIIHAIAEIVEAEIALGLEL
jgi:hypothetical protein